MKFTRIRVDRFGPIVGLDTGEGSDLPGFIAVEGPNETGKSAFHNLLSALLFGFYPATRDQNPFTPWQGGDIEAHAEIQLADEARWELHRRLLSSPRGELIQGDRVQPLDNRSLPGITQVDAKIYGQVYAISGAELNRVATDAWHAVRDQLVVGMGSQDLRAPREVVDAFRAAADRLWRSTNRGKHRHKELRAEIQEVIRERGEAESRDRQLRAVLERLDLLGSELDDLRDRRTEAAERLERLHELVMIRAIVRAKSRDIAETRASDAGGSVEDCKVHDTRFYHEGEWHDAVIYDRSKLQEGMRVDGPAIVIEMDSTTVVLPGFEATVDPIGSLLINPAR